MCCYCKYTLHVEEVLLQTFQKSISKFSGRPEHPLPPRGTYFDVGGGVTYLDSSVGYANGGANHQQSHPCWTGHRAESRSRGLKGQSGLRNQVMAAGLGPWGHRNSPPLDVWHKRCGRGDTTSTTGRRPIHRKPVLPYDRQGETMEDDN